MEASSTDTAGVGTDEQNRTKILSLPFFAPTTLVMDVSKSHFRAPGPAGAKPQGQGDLASSYAQHKAWPLPELAAGPEGLPDREP